MPTHFESVVVRTAKVISAVGAHQLTAMPEELSRAIWAKERVVSFSGRFTAAAAVGLLRESGGVHIPLHGQRVQQETGFDSKQSPAVYARIRRRFSGLICSGGAS